jgi:POT family proton-dependent oligopeptide transporter
MNEGAFLDDCGHVRSAPETGLFGQPRGLMFLFLVEMWERFSFYGMKALLILYLVNEQHWSVARAATLYGNYTALAYISPMLGGYLADRFLGARRSMIIGGLIISLGHFTFALQNDATFLLGLCLIVLGTGLFKPNVSTMVGELYTEDDQRRASGFTIFFMGISVGAFLGPLACGYLAQRVGWSYGFAAAGVGMVMGLGLFLRYHQRYLPGIGGPDRISRIAKRQSSHESQGDRKRIFAVVVVVALTIPFWACYEQVGSSLSLFADRHIARDLGSFLIPASWFQSINPVVILVFAPLLALLWKRLESINKEPAAPLKMVGAYFLMAIGFGFAVRAGYLSESVALVSPLWFIAIDLFRSWGELLLSPVGLSYITEIAPKHYQSRLMAAWFLAEGIGNKLAGSLAAQSAVLRPEYFYAIFVAIALVFMIAFIAVNPLLNRLKAQN